MTWTGPAFRRRRRLTVTLQAEASECGLACLAMVAAHHGHHIPLEELRRADAVSRRGMTLADLITAANRLGFVARALRLDMEHLRELSLPAICHWQLDHFVVLEKVRRRDVVVVDPAAGRHAVPVGAFSAAFTGIALELEPGARFEIRRRSPRALSLLSMLRATPGTGAMLLKIGCVSLLLQAFALTAPFYSQTVIDHVLVTSDRDLLTVLVIVFAALALLQTAFGALRAWLVVYLSARLRFAWATAVFQRLVNLPTAYFEARTTGDVQSRVRSLDALEAVVTRQFVEAVMDGLMTVATVALMIAYAPTLAAMSAAAVVVYAIVRSVSFGPLLGRQRTEVLAAARRDSHLLSTVHSIVTIRNYGFEGTRHQAHQHRTVDVVNADVDVARLQIAVGASSGLCFAIEHVLIVCTGALMILGRELTVGMLVAFLAYRTQFIDRAAALIDRLTDMLLARVHVDRLSDLLLAEPDPAFSLPGTLPDTGEKPRPAAEHAAERPRIVAGALAAQTLTFRYAANLAPVVDRVTFSVAPGEYVAITAPSGHGKSTLLKLLMGLLTPTAGTIHVDGQPLCAATLRGYRRACAAVMQQDALLDGTLFDNITSFDPHPDPDRVQEVTRQADLDTDIERLPMGYQTVVGDSNDTLSGGQRQRVMIARALYRRPAILFLDEATCHLDAATAAHVHRSVASLSVTRVVVSHDPAVLSDADRVIDLAAVTGASDTTGPADGSAAFSPTAVPAES